MISLFLDINAHIPLYVEYVVCFKQRCTLYLDLRKPRNTTNLIIWYRDFKRGVEIPDCFFVFTSHFFREWQAVKESLQASMIVRIPK